MKNKLESVIANKVKQSHIIKLNRLLRYSFGIPRNDGIKKLLFLFTIILSINSFSQEIKYKEYSYTEFFKMIENEPSDTFTLKNAAIAFDSILEKQHTVIVNKKTGETTLLRKDTIVIDKEIRLQNVVFKDDVDVFKDEAFYNKTYFKGGRLYTIQFNKKIEIFNCFIKFENCVFKEEVRVSINSNLNDVYNAVKHTVYEQYGSFKDNKFKKGVYFSSSVSNSEDTVDIQIGFENCEFWPLPMTGGNVRSSIFWIENLRNFSIENSIFHGDQEFSLISKGGNTLSIQSNDFKNNYLSIHLAREREEQGLDFTSNIINHPTAFSIRYVKPENNLDWLQFKKGIFFRRAFSEYIKKEYKSFNQAAIHLGSKDSVRNDYMKNGRHRLAYNFKEETKLLSKLKNHYNSQLDKQYENAVFMEIKDLETNRLHYLYQENPSFDRYFKWKVNQFLKVFSAYGTEPSKAVTFSFYVILFFAFIYLFFPNHWDSHGKNRILDRFQFFVKYMDQKSGMHEVYLQEQQNDLLVYEDFKTLLIKKGNRIPKFFIAAGLPLYNWAVSGTKISASLLKRVDIMQGTWSDLTQSKRIWKGILLVCVFLAGVVYDIFIKMLNALMLSINTFTTLGFGEIPIKGLPRYLAIIQGFIGWFMLTIFSVSLISQLIN
jgi:hypothetical protein